VLKETPLGRLKIESAQWQWIVQAKEYKPRRTDI